MSDIVDKLRGWQCDCLVHLNGGNTTGAGFFIAPGVILTCAHVAGDKTGATVTATWSGTEFDARIVVTSPIRPTVKGLAPYPDLAILRLVDPPKVHPCLWLDDRRPATDTRLIIAGYSDVYGPASETSGMVTCVGHEKLTNGGEAIRVREDEFSPGMSGGPVLNPDTGGVCGLIKTARQPGAERGGLVIPTGSLRALNTEIYRTVRHEHDEYHGREDGESGRIDIKKEFDRRHISADEERELRAILATTDYRDDLVAFYRTRFGGGQKRLHIYGDVAIELDATQTEKEILPPTLDFVAILTARLPQTAALRDWLMSTAGRMQFHEQVKARLKELQRQPKPKPPTPPPPLDSSPPPERPPPDRSPPDRSPPDRSRIGVHKAIVVLVVAVLVAIASVLWLLSRGSPAGCGHPAEVRALTSTDQLEAYRQVADEFETWTAAQRDGCRTVNVYLYDAPQEKARDALVRGWVDEPSATGGTHYLRDVGPQADVWLPGSQVELDAVAGRLAGADPALIASSPLVLAVPQSLAGPAADRKPLSWLASLDMAITNGWGVVRPDPVSSTVGELATVAMYAKADRSTLLPREIEGWLERSLDVGRYPLGESDGLLCRQQQLVLGVDRPAAVITSEQAIVRYNNGDPAGSRCRPTGQRGVNPLVAFYPADTYRIDHYFVQFRWGDEAQGQATRDAATAWRTWLAGEDGRRALLRVGLRPSGMGRDLGLPLTTENGVLPDWPFGHPVTDIPGADVRGAALATYNQARRPARVLLAVDASGSMNAPTDDQGTTRFGVALRGVGASLAKMSEQRDELGLWIFSTKADPSGVKQLVPIGRSATATRALLDGGPQLRPSGDTPLYRAIAAGVRTLAAHGDEAINALVVLTDGQDTASPESLGDLAREIAEHRDIRIFVIAIGDASCDAPVFAKLTNDTAGECLPASAGTVDDTLTTLFRVLWTKGDR